MATTRRSLGVHGDSSQGSSDAGRELFEACRNGDINKVKNLIGTHNVNAKDTAGRKSSPLHFAAGYDFSSNLSKKITKANNNATKVNCVPIVTDIQEFNNTVKMILFFNNFFMRIGPNK